MENPACALSDIATAKITIAMLTVIFQLTRPTQNGPVMLVIICPARNAEPKNPISLSLNPRWVASPPRMIGNVLYTRLLTVKNAAIANYAVVGEFRS